MSDNLTLENRLGPFVMTLIAALGVDRTKNWVAKNHGADSIHFQLLEQYGPQIIATVQEHFSSKPFNLLQNIASLAEPQAASGPAIGYKASEAQTVYRQYQAAKKLANSSYHNNALFPTSSGFRAFEARRKEADETWPDLLKRAAELGHPEAQYDWVMFGVMPAMGGRASPPRRTEAMRLLAMAAAQGHAKAEALYNQLAEEERAEQPQRPAIEAPPQQRQQQPAADRQAEAARLCDEGLAAYNRGELAQAFRLWEQAALHGNRAAMFNVGDMFNDGEYVAQDYKLAAQWWTKAAEQNDLQAIYRLAGLYSSGLGVPRNEPEAVRLLTLAATQDYAAAQYQLAVALIKGYGVTADRAKGIQWIERAAALKFKLAVDALPKLRAEDEAKRREREAQRESEQRHSGNLSRREAMALLELSEPFTPEDVKRQHKAIVQREHPDHGGNTYIMQLANRARDTLLKG